jgi:hypothetical protein
LIEQINEIIYMPFIIKILANLLTISFANDLLINACNFSIYKNNTIINKEVNPSYIITYFEVCLSRLELSNPFLYANKTRELRE